MDHGARTSDLSWNMLSGLLIRGRPAEEEKADQAIDLIRIPRRYDEPAQMHHPEGQADPKRDDETEPEPRRHLDQPDHRDNREPRDRAEYQIGRLGPIGEN